MDLPSDGEYVVDVADMATHIWGNGMEFENPLVVTLDNKIIYETVIGGEEDMKLYDQVQDGALDKANAKLKNIKFFATAGPHKIGVAFLEKTQALNTRRLQNYVRSSSDTIDFSGYPHIDEVILTGPFNATGVGQTPSRRRIFTCTPKVRAEETACARQILATVARRAYRADVSESDIRTLMTFFAEGRKDGGSFESGIDLALRRVLASPKFIFRTERDQPSRSTPRRDPAAANAAGSVSVAAGQAYRISDTELASRLSFFLWSSIPDDELLDAAARRTLSTGATFERQVRRMLSDAKAQSLIDNFAGQWLQLRNLKSKQPNSHEFPDFDDNLRQAVLTETELFFASIIREDRSVLDLITADYTFLNERLAKHYGIQHVYGSHFRRVVLPDATRRGLLGKGAVLMVTSHPHRTSPVIRGKWVLENLLGAAPPPPPDDIPALQEADLGEAASLRQRLEQHRENPSCAACHAQMDPIGFGLENYDADGSWRTKDGKFDIDSSGTLPDGRSFTGAKGLKQVLLSQSHAFTQNFTEKLLTYALGRGTERSDRALIGQISGKVAQNDYRFAALVTSIVNSPAFQMRSISGDTR